MDLDLEIARMAGEGPVPEPRERPTKPAADVTERAVARFEDDGGPALPEKDEPTFRSDDIGGSAEDYEDAEAEALYRAGLTTPTDPPVVPAIFGLQAEAMPLSPPERPMILADTVARIAFIRDDQPLKPIAMEVDFTGEDAIMAQAQLLPGRIEITLTNGFGRVRTLQLSPAEFMLVMMYGDRFFAELPR